MPKRYTITAALPYTNGPIHIGHLAGVYVPADIYARFLRIKGHDVAFICGSDEHGVPGEHDAPTARGRRRPATAACRRPRPRAVRHSGAESLGEIDTLE